MIQASDVFNILPATWDDNDLEQFNELSFFRSLSNTIRDVQVSGMDEGDRGVHPSTISKDASTNNIQRDQDTEFLI